MDIITPAFLDVSLLRFGPHQQILQIVGVEGYKFFVGEEVVRVVRRVERASLLSDLMADGRLNSHSITELEDIHQMTKILSRCGVCRGEICTYLAAKRTDGIVVSHDLRAHNMLTCHIPGVTSVQSDEFLKNAA